MARPDTSPIAPESRRSIAARANGSKGGQATAARHDEEWLRARALKGGTTTRDMYSVEFYAHINQQRKSKAGWPQGKLRTAGTEAKEVVEQSGLSAAAQAVLQHMLGR